jgi:ABC-type branched-subunit amino acid transport system substrate-binding protein
MRISSLLLLAPLLGALACTDGATPPPAAERIPIGILLDEASDDSASIEQGALTAVRQLNALGGVLGHPLEAVQIRYKSDDPAATAENAVRVQLAATPKMPFVLGAVSSGQTLGLVNVAKEKNLVIGSASATRDGLGTPFEGRFFRTVPADAGQANFMADILAGVFAPAAGPGDAGVAGDGIPKCTNVTIAYQTGEAYASSLATKLESVLKTQKGMTPKVVAVSASATTADGYAADATLAINECVFLIHTLASYAKDFYRASYALGQKTGRTPRMFGSDGVSGVRNGQVDPPLNGVIYTGPDPAPPDEPYREFQRLFGAANGLTTVDEASFRSSAYDVIALYALAAARAGTFDGSKVHPELINISRPAADGTRFTPKDLGGALGNATLKRRVNFDGASGPVDVDETGDVAGKYVAYRVVVQGTTATIARAASSK